MNCFALSLHPYACVHAVSTLPWKRSCLFSSCVRAHCRLASDLCNKSIHSCVRNKTKWAPNFRGVWFSSNHMSVCRSIMCVMVYVRTLYSNRVSFFRGVITQPLFLKNSFKAMICALTASKHIFSVGSAQNFWKGLACKGLFVFISGFRLTTNGRRKKAEKDN